MKRSVTLSAFVIPESSGELDLTFSTPVRSKAQVFSGDSGEASIPSIPNGGVIEVLSEEAEEDRREGCLGLGSVGSAEGSLKGRGEVQEASGGGGVDDNDLKGSVELSKAQGSRDEGPNV
jgi:hypothetical protein